MKSVMIGVRLAAIVAASLWVSGCAAPPPQNAGSGGDSAFLEAVLSNDTVAVKAALAEDPELAKTADADGLTPLHLAAEDTDAGVDVATALIEAGADVNATDADGNTPLHTAASQGNTALIKLLLENGADRVAKNAAGETALEIAQKYGRADSEEALK